LLIGTLLGTAVAALILYLRRVHREATGLDDFLAMGLIGLSYGLALLCHSYGFLSVFAAGLALRRVERHNRPDEQADERNNEPSVFSPGQTQEEVATDPEKAPAAMAEAVLEFNEQLERIGELLVVVLIGAMLSWSLIPSAAAWFVPLLLLGIRPVAVALGLLGSGVPLLEKGYAAWFGIRGIGSVYYLMYAIVHGMNKSDAQLLTGLTLATIAASAIAHGASVTPLMKLYTRKSEER
jgi:NhaP-type Na+/H+ or K+/H+ antiporter